MDGKEDLVPSKRARIEDPSSSKETKIKEKGSTSRNTDESDDSVVEISVISEELYKENPRNSIEGLKRLLEEAKRNLQNEYERNRSYTDVLRSARDALIGVRDNAWGYSRNQNVYQLQTSLLDLAALPLDERYPLLGQRQCNKNPKWLVIKESSEDNTSFFLLVFRFSPARVTEKARFGQEYKGLVDKTSHTHCAPFYHTYTHIASHPGFTLDRRGWIITFVGFCPRIGSMYILTGLNSPNELREEPCYLMGLQGHLVQDLWLTKKNNRGIYEALEKIKSELMSLGFISLLLTVGQGPISKICISEKVANTWLPCGKKQKETHENSRILVSLSDSCGSGKVPFMSSDGIHQLHILIFVLAVFHVLYCILTMALGQAKMKSWNRWEKETRTLEYRFSHDNERLRLARETTFGRRHLSFWTNSPFLIWIVCFFRQFVRSVPKVDYLTLRHGFIMAHLGPQSSTQFDFQKYINRALEEDFKVVVGIRPPIWFMAVLFLLFNNHGWYSYLWLSFLPLIIILLVGTKLQVIIATMGLRILGRAGIVMGVPVVQPGDDLFWFNRPHLLLYLINFIHFQNSFQLAFFIWSWYEFGIKSCFHKHLMDIIIRISIGVFIQILCGYATLPLYALVTQMGSTMKPTIFSKRIAVALRNWYHRAKKDIKQSNGSVTQMSIRSTTPSHHMSPVHQLHRSRSGEVDSMQTSPRRSNVDMEDWETNSPSPSHPNISGDGSSSTLHHHLRQMEQDYAEDEDEVRDYNEADLDNLVPQHKIDIASSQDWKMTLGESEYPMTRGEPKNVIGL
ncbi:MLO-like protein 6 [Tripterygium wilfordii]|uniref:MLO-like protein 6 n=1 Tax=Tripterygium wilfordii TaxID=458696 RepID=UPI0018F814F5|nr:MLO-like protein 6 [Tripterygium wilfordii]